MKLVDKLLERSSGCCEACGKKIRNKTPAVLKLFESGIGIRQGPENTLVACIGAVAELSRLSVAERVIRLIDKAEPFQCSYREPRKQEQKIAPKKKPKAQGRSVVRAIPTYLYQESMRTNPRPPPEQRLKNPPPLFLDESGKISTPRYSDQIEPINAPSFDVDKVWTACSRRTLTPVQIQNLLDQSNSLNLPPRLVEMLDALRNEKLKSLRTKYTIDPEGVVTFDRSGPK